MLFSFIEIMKKNIPRSIPGEKFEFRRFEQAFFFFFFFFKQQQIGLYDSSSSCKIFEKLIFEILQKLNKR